MENQLFLAIIGGIACVLGTFFGAFIALFLKISNNKIQSVLLEFSAGLMLSVVFLDLISNAIKETNVINVILGIFLGVFFMNITENITKKSNQNSLLQTGIILAIGLAMHNLPEGLALGSAINIDNSLFYTLVISIFIHDIPEGILVGLPLSIGGMSKIKILIISFLTGFFALIGAILGVHFTNHNIIGSLLSIASGAMLFIVFFEIIPSSKKLHQGNIPSFFNIFGIILGIVISNIL